MPKVLQESLAALQEVEMDKISSIIPSSSRVTSVDMKDSSPIRSGVPAFGRSESVNPHERAPVDALKSSTEAQKEMSDWRSKDTAQANIAKSVSENFFGKHATEAEPTVNTGRVGASAAVHAFEEDDEIEPSVVSRAASAVTPKRGELYPKGSFLNTVA
jgi:hypothetical protein